MLGFGCTEADKSYEYWYEIKFNPDLKNQTDGYTYAFIQVESTEPMVFFTDENTNIIYAMATENCVSSYNITSCWDDRAISGVSASDANRAKYEISSGVHFSHMTVFNLVNKCTNNVIIFDSKNSAIAYIESGDTTGMIYGVSWAKFVPHNDIDTYDMSIRTQHQSLINNNNYSDAITYLDNKEFAKGVRASLFNNIVTKIKSVQSALLRKDVSETDFELISDTEPIAEEMGERIFWLQKY